MLNNGDLNQVTWELRGMGGTPKIGETQTVPAFGYAEMLCLNAVRVTAPEEFGPARDAALAADRPTVIDARRSGRPTLPPHITRGQVNSYASMESR